MSVLPGHPFNLGEDWRRAIDGGVMDWRTILREYVAAVDWPASLFWRDVASAHPEALVVLSTRESAQVWVESMQATVLRVARKALAPDWKDGRDLVDMVNRFLRESVNADPDSSEPWLDHAQLAAAYERHNEVVRRSVPSSRLVDWRAADGWEPLCAALKCEVPADPFPWTNRREEWG